MIYNKFLLSDKLWTVLGNDDTDDTDSHDEEDDEDMILDVTGRGYIPPEELRGQPQNIAAQHAVSR